MSVPNNSVEPLIYFVSGMWCTTCAKTIQNRAVKVTGVRSAEVSFPSKLLRVEISSAADASVVDLALLENISKTGFGIRKQSAGWVRTFGADLERESGRTLSNLLVGMVWFLTMWSSMIAFAGYLGGITEFQQFRLSIASAAFGVSAIAIGIIPYARSGIRALRANRTITLDLFIFFGGLVASAYTVINLANGRAISYADSGAMVIAILLLAKKIETLLAKRVSTSILFEINSEKAEVRVLKSKEWVDATSPQIRKGDHLRFVAGETISFDGTLWNKEAQVNRHLLTGENLAVKIERGDSVVAGSIAESELEIQVDAALGDRRIDRWAEIALAAGSRTHPYSKLFERIESGLAITAFLGACFLAMLRLLQGGGPREVVESFFVGILIFCPCLFASIIPLTKQIAHLALLKMGALLNRSEALFDLTALERIYFDKTGTLEGVESSFVEFNPGAFSDHDIPGLLRELARKSRHPVLTGLSFGSSIKYERISKVQEYAGDGAVGRTEKGEIVVGRKAFVEAYADFRSPKSLGETHYPVVAFRGAFVGQITTKSIFDAHSRDFLKVFLGSFPNAKIEILSGDPHPEAGASLLAVDPSRITYTGNLSPESKSHAIGPKSLFVGDGLNDTLALSQATVSCRIGQRVRDFAPVDIEIRGPDLRTLIRVVRYANYYKRVLFQTGFLALAYNGAAITLAALGYFSPFGAAVAMLSSFLLLMGSALRLFRYE
jgi:cation transport ATPase